MEIFEIVILVAIFIGSIYINSRFEDKIRTISDLKDELRRTTSELELKQSSLEWHRDAYNKALERYFNVLERYDIPENWESLDDDEDDEDYEDDEMVEVIVHGKDGTRIEKIPAIHVSFKEEWWNK